MITIREKSPDPPLTPPRLSDFSMLYSENIQMTEFGFYCFLYNPIGE
jgi:hypothetical protein